MSPLRVQTTIPRTAFESTTRFFLIFRPANNVCIVLTTASGSNTITVVVDGGRKNAFTLASGGRFIGRSASLRPHAPSGLNAFASNDFPDAYRCRVLITLPERLLYRIRAYLRHRVSPSQPTPLSLSPPASSWVIQMTDPVYAHANVLYTCIRHGAGRRGELCVSGSFAGFGSSRPVYIIYRLTARSCRKRSKRMLNEDCRERDAVLSRRLCRALTRGRGSVESVRRSTHRRPRRVSTVSRQFRSCCRRSFPLASGG